MSISPAVFSCFQGPAEANLSRELPQPIGHTEHLLAGRYLQADTPRVARIIADFFDSGEREDTSRDCSPVVVASFLAIGRDPVYGVVPTSETAVAPPSALGVRVRTSAWSPLIVGANSTGRVQLWPVGMPAEQVFSEVVRTWKL